MPGICILLWSMPDIESFFGAGLVGGCFGVAAGRCAGMAIPGIDIPGMFIPGMFMPPPAPDVRARAFDAEGCAVRPRRAPLRRGWSPCMGIAIAPSSAGIWAIMAMWSAIMRM